MSRRAFTFFIIIIGLFEFGRMAVTFYFPLYFKDALGFSGERIGWLFGVASLASLLAMVPMGIGSDVVTPRRLIAGGLLAAATAYFILGVIGAFFAGILLLFLLRDMGNSLFTQSSNALMYKTLHHGRAAQRIGAYQVFMALGTGIGMISGGYFLTLYGFPALFWFIGALLVALAVASMLLPESKAEPTTFLHYQNEILRPHVLLFMLIFFLFATHFGAESTSYALFLEQNFHFSRIQMGYYMASELIFLGGIGLFLGMRRDRNPASLHWIIVGGLLASGIGHIGMTYPDVWTSVAFRGLHGLGDGAMFFAMRTGINRFFKVESVGGSSSLIAFAMALGGFLGSLVFGPLGAAWGYAYPLWISGVIVVIASLMVAGRQSILR